MGNLISKYKIFKKKKLNTRHNKNGQSGMEVEYEDTVSEHGDADEVVYSYMQGDQFLSRNRKRQLQSNIRLK